MAFELVAGGALASPAWPLLGLTLFPPMAWSSGLFFFAVLLDMVEPWIDDDDAIEEEEEVDFCDSDLLLVTPFAGNDAGLEDLGELPPVPILATSVRIIVFSLI